MKSLPPALPISVLCAVTFGGAGLAAAFSGTHDENARAISALIQLMAAMMAVAAILFAGWRSAPREVIDDFQTRMRWKTALFLVALGAYLLPFRISIETFVELPLLLMFPKVTQSLYHLRQLDQTVSTAFFPPLLLGSTFIAQVIVGPVLEEIVFRGCLLSRWTATRGPLIGLLLSSSLFGCLHFPRITSAFACGLVLGALYIQFKSLIAPIIAHIFTNLFSWALPFMTEGPWEKDLSDVLKFSNWRTEIASITLTLAIALVLVRFRRHLQIEGHVKRLIAE